jgi:hypothetical protein
MTSARLLLDGLGESDLLVGTVEHGVILAQEDVTDDEERDARVQRLEVQEW